MENRLYYKKDVLERDNNDVFSDFNVIKYKYRVVFLGVPYKKPLKALKWLFSKKERGRIYKMAVVVRVSDEVIKDEKLQGFCDNEAAKLKAEEEIKDAMKKYGYRDYYIIDKNNKAKK